MRSNSISWRKLSLGQRKFLKNRGSKKDKENPGSVSAILNLMITLPL